MGFVQVRLEVGAINISNMAVVLGQDKHRWAFGCYYLTLSKAEQRFRAERNSNATPATERYQSTTNQKNS